jgi:hypothetical protein
MLRPFWSILWPFGIFCGHLVYFMVFGIFSPVLVCCAKKNLATQLQRVRESTKYEAVVRKTIANLNCR